jgi:hypothetical protein
LSQACSPFNFQIVCLPVLGQWPSYLCLSSSWDYIFELSHPPFTKKFFVCDFHTTFSLCSFCLLCWLFFCLYCKYFSTSEILPEPSFPLLAGVSEVQCQLDWVVV